MPYRPQRLSDLPELRGTLKLDRTLLRDTAVEKLRAFIGSGLIPEGTKISEREVSEMLGISRMPARDALMTLEYEGLVENRLDGRYVIRLTEDDVRNFLQVRAVLEGLAARLATRNMNEEGRALLLARLHDLQDATANRDFDLYATTDIGLHQAIWAQAGNPQLLRTLQSMVGIILVLTVRSDIFGDFDALRVLDDHRELVDLILSGDADAAGRAFEEELAINATAAALRVLRVPEHTAVPENSAEGGTQRSE
jgi:DNA-binding GntR family transcriptional regulator